MLPVQVGCSYNACRFCMLFKHLKFRELPMEQIEAELKRVKNAGGCPSTVFLGDGNAFALGSEKLSGILDMIHSYFPGCVDYHMDATVKSIEAVSDKELENLREKGASCLYIGIESGLEDVLEFMNKGNTLEEARVQIARLKKAGIDYAAHIMTGVAGKGRGIENAEATAAFLNSTRPVSVTNFSMFTEKQSPLWSSVEDGTFVPATVLEAMEEEYRLIEELDIPIKYEGFQDFIEVRTKGVLPLEREKMLNKLAGNIEEYRNKPPVYACIDVEPGVCACTCKESCYQPG